MPAKRRPANIESESAASVRSVQLAACAERIRSCRKCVDEPDGPALTHEPRPILQVSPTARIAIFGQAPGLRAHDAGLPFKDPSGVRLRSWMGIDEATFYDASRIAIAPMGFCFPGYDAKGADLPPRRECAPLWRDELLTLLPQIELALVIGGYAQKWHLGKRAKATLRETVRDWDVILAGAVSPGVGLPRGLPHAAMFPLPHPSWRNNAWLKANPWFDERLLPRLRRRVALALRSRP